MLACKFPQVPGVQLWEKIKVPALVINWHCGVAKRDERLKN